MHSSCGNITITASGTYDVKDKINAIVDIKEKQLGTKKITENGTYKATDDNLDGYSEVEVATSGVNIDDYFKSSASGVGSSYYPGIINFIKKGSRVNMICFIEKNGVLCPENMKCDYDVFIYTKKIIKSFLQTKKIE